MVILWKVWGRNWGPLEVLNGDVLGKRAGRMEVSEEAIWGYGGIKW